MNTSACPRCGDRLNETARSERRCRSCGATLPDEAAEQPTAVVETQQPCEHVTEFDRLPEYPGTASGPESSRPEETGRRSDQGETLAVLALLLPLVAQGVALAGRFDSSDMGMALGLGTVVATALLLAVDAALLGTIDRHGFRRAGPGALALGMILFWIIYYPAAFFRRQHFGRPNLGPLAILVAVFFVAAPFVQRFLAFGVVGVEPPTCTSREVVAMVDDLIRKSPVGASVRSVSGHREISYDPGRQTRKGQCLVNTQSETITASYNVKILNPSNGTFGVDVEPFIPSDPPSCTDPDVTALVGRLVRNELGGSPLITVAGHEEVRYDRERKIRYGRCRVTLAGRTDDVVYKVSWVDQKTGQYQVEIQP